LLMGCYPAPFVEPITGTPPTSGEDPIARRAPANHAGAMKKTPKPDGKALRPARRETSALTPEEMSEMAARIFSGNGRQEGRVTEHWPEAEVQMLAGRPANGTAL
jgi:hypothetical protein